jgi:hypothetical protein
MTITDIPIYLRNPIHRPVHEIVPIPGHSRDEYGSGRANSICGWCHRASGVYKDIQTCIDRLVEHHLNDCDGEQVPSVMIVGPPDSRRSEFAPNYEIVDGHACHISWCRAFNDFYPHVGDAYNSYA